MEISKNRGRGTNISVLPSGYKITILLIYSLILVMEQTVFKR